MVKNSLIGKKLRADCLRSGIWGVFVKSRFNLN